MEKADVQSIRISESQNLGNNSEVQKFGDSEILPTINTPADMKALSDEQLKTLAGEVRSFMVETVSKTGGHLGAGLGVVELTTALHAVFDTPSDRIIWDVGHQAYPHKILTGRKDRLHTIRQGGGLSGFTKRSESEYDPFGTAHSSTSISAGLGMAVARELQKLRASESRNLGNTAEIQKLGDSEILSNHVIAVIGDGAMSAGMAYEALNNAGSVKVNGKRPRLIVILNDNEMSIAPPVGAMSRMLTKMVSSKPYITAREVGKKIVDNLPSPLRHAVKRAEEGARVAAGGGAFFEEMGFYYIGPVDGHNMDHLLPVLRNIRDDSHDAPILLHVRTQKGKGYAPAENSPCKMHGVKKFDVVTGEQFKSKANAPTYTKVFAESLIAEAAKDDKIVAITAAMPDGTGLDLFAHEFPERTFDVGIAEQHGVTFAAGLATEGFKPFCAIYSTFLQRGYDQVVHDVALQNLPVRFAIDRAGLVGADGQTHAGAFDTAYLGCLPNMVLMAASDEAELKHIVATAAAYNDGPIAFRYPRGEGVGTDMPERGAVIEIGKGRIIYQTNPKESLRRKPESSTPKQPDSGLRPNDPENVALLSYGTRLEECRIAAKSLEEQGHSVTIADARFAKPLDEDLIKSLISHHSSLITIEEGSIGGFGSFVLEFLSRENLLNGQCRVQTMHLPDIFQDHDDPAKQYETAGLTAKDIVQRALSK